MLFFLKNEKDQEIKKGYGRQGVARTDQDCQKN